MVSRFTAWTTHLAYRFDAEMEMKKLHMGTMSYGWDSMDEVAHQLVTAFGGQQAPGQYYLDSQHSWLSIADNMNTEHIRRQSSVSGTAKASKGRRDISARLRDAVMALATCHNVSTAAWLFERLAKLCAILVRSPRSRTTTGR